MKGQFEQILPDLERIEKRIHAQASHFDSAVEGYIKYATSSEGKRIRPALTLLSAQAQGECKDSHLDLAVIVELIHLASLIHDDIMDQAEIRRGQATVCAKWGSEISVLVGDALFAHALSLSVRLPEKEMSYKISDAANEVCTGEILQTQRRFDLKLSIADYLKIVKMKTGALFRISCEIASMINGQSEEEQQAYAIYGENLGTAYQIYDDCLDIFGSEETFGKTLGTDLSRGKLTLPVIWVLEQMGEDEHKQVSEALLNGKEADHEAIIKRVVERGGHLYSVRKAQELLTRAQSALDMMPNNDFLETLRLLPESLSEDLNALKG